MRRTRLAQGNGRLRHSDGWGENCFGHGTQQGTVCLSTQKVRVNKPRLRKKGGGRDAEVGVPAYEAMQDDTSLRSKLSDILMSSVSTRKYERVVPEMAESCGISKSSVSREFIGCELAQLVATLGAARLVFGTGMPFKYVDPVTLKLNMLAVSPTDAAAIAAGNVRLLLNLSQAP